MRINVYISSTGFCSRREADHLIQSGRVMINGMYAQIGSDVSDTDIVSIDGKTIGKRPKAIYMAFNKPEGVESTTDQAKPHNIIDYLHYPERIFPIGRLDKDSSGLILLTNDGMIVNKILRSENEHDKEYVVELDNDITNEFLMTMAAGVKIYNPARHEYTITKPCKIKQIDTRKFTIILTQGLNRQIRRMTKELGFNVLYLHRIRIMNINLGSLPLGEYRFLIKTELDQLLRSIGGK
ncbi:MAG: pseudouridine synthase [Candidatus Izemoplasmatales bacterium]|jgi:pseudouridine synthase|nr:pseudouridine synthase [Candidatus Izemoplasmatales bacterium]MDD3865025.1 pseudouridine synthase [Candidatus Izemoplasmatales bacterium]